MLLEQAKTGNDCFFMLGTYQYVCTMYVSLLAGEGRFVRFLFLLSTTERRVNVSSWEWRRRRRSTIFFSPCLFISTLSKVILLPSPYILYHLETMYVDTM